MTRAGKDDNNKQDNTRDRGKTNSYVWKNGMKLNDEWGSKKKRWWLSTLKEKEPNRYKSHMREFYQKRMDNLGS